MDKVKVEQLIVTSQSRRGNGKSDRSPIRIITQVYSFDGVLIAENDPKTYTIEMVVGMIEDSIKYSTCEGMQVDDVLDRIFKERNM